MMTIAVGQQAPSFRLPAGQGGQIGLDDYRGRSSVIVWFTKGMACPFCRSHMSQLARGYSKFKALGAELIEVTPTTPERARSYVQKFRIPFPYLCDPSYQTWPVWGLEVRSHPLTWYASRFLQGITTPPPPNDFGPTKPFFSELPKVLADDDMGFFIIDRGGVVRYVLSAAFGRQIPSNDEITRALELCSRGA